MGDQQTPEVTNLTRQWPETDLQTYPVLLLVIFPGQKREAEDDGPDADINNFTFLMCPISVSRLRWMESPTLAYKSPA